MPINDIIDGDDNDFWDIKYGNGWDNGENGIAGDGDTGDGDEILNSYEEQHLSSNQFNIGRLNVFRYCIFGRRLTGHTGGTGEAENIPGDDFWISGGNIPTWLAKKGYKPQAFSGTFMHEFGHTLGLRHNGDVNTPHDSGDYVSIMSQHYQVNYEKDTTESPPLNGWPNGGADWIDWAGMELNWAGDPNFGYKFNSAHDTIEFRDWDNLDFTGIIRSLEGKDPVP